MEKLTVELTEKIMKDTEWQSSKEILGTVQALETIYGEQGNEAIYDFTSKLQNIAWEKEKIEKIEQFELIFNNVKYSDNAYLEYDFENNNESLKIKVASYENDSRIYRYEFKNTFMTTESDLTDLFNTNLKVKIFSPYDCTGRYFSQFQYYHVAQGKHDKHVIYDLQHLDI